MFLIVLKDFEIEKKYIITKEKGFFGNSYGQISYKEIKKLGIGKSFKLGKKEYLILKPTLQDYILYGIKRKTQIIYPFDSSIIINQLGLTSNDKIFESGIGSGALSLLILNTGANLTSFEKNENFINLAKDNIKIRQKYTNQNFSHQIIKKNFIEDNFEEYNNYFDKGVLDLKELEKGLQNSYKILKPGGILICWSPTTNQVENILNNLNNMFFPEEIINLNITTWSKIGERFRISDWQPGSRGFIIKLRKII